MIDLTPEQQVQRGEEAQRLLDNWVLQSALDDIRAELVEESIHAKELSAREAARNQYLALSLITGKLNGYILDGGIEHKKAPL